MYFINSYRKDIFLITFFFILAHGLMLFNKGIYWDDWTVYGVKGDAIFESFQRTGVPLKGMIHYLFNPYPQLYRLTTFFVFLLTTLMFYFILKSVKEIHATDRLIIVLLFAVFPANFSKICLSMTPHMICVFLFTSGIYSLLKYIKSRRKFYYISSHIAFFVSFQIDSLLVFFALPIMFIIYHEKIYKGLPFSLAKIKGYLSFLCLPVIYWVLKNYFLQPYGLFEGYNKVRSFYVIRSLLYVPLSAYNNITLPLLNTINFSLPVAKYYIFLLPLFLFLYKKLNRNLISSRRSANILFLMGVFFYALAVFPYIAVGRSGLNYGVGWHSRDQILIPFSVGFTILYGLKIIINELKINSGIISALCAFLICIFTVNNIQNCLDFERAWFKQEALIKIFKKSNIVHDNSTFVIKDNTEFMNVFNEKFRFYEYTGLLKYAFKDESKLAFNYEDKQSLEHKYQIYIKNPEYNFINYKFTSPQYIITIDRGPRCISLNATLKLTMLKFFNKRKYQENISDIILVNFIPWEIK